MIIFWAACDLFFGAALLLKSIREFSCDEEFMYIEDIARTVSHHQLCIYCYVLKYV